MDRAEPAAVMGAGEVDVTDVVAANPPAPPLSARPAEVESAGDVGGATQRGWMSLLGRLGFSGGRSKPPYTEAQLRKAREAVAKLSAYGPVGNPVDGSPPTTKSSKHSDAEAAKGSLQTVSSKPSNSSVPEDGTLYVLERNIGGHFGFQLLASLEGGGTRVHSVDQDAAVGLSGLNIDDVITEVNGISVYRMQYADIIKRLETSGNRLRVRFMTSADAAQRAADENAAATVLQRNYRAHRCRLALAKKLPSSRWDPPGAVTNVNVPPPRKVNVSAPAMMQKVKPETSKGAKTLSAQMSQKSQKCVSFDPIPRVETASNPSPVRMSNPRDEKTPEKAHLSDEPVMPISPSDHDSPDIKTKAKSSSSAYDSVEVKDGGTRVKLVGSKIHAKIMGVYRELVLPYQNCPVYIRKLANGPTSFLFYKKKSWCVANRVGGKKVVITATSPSNRPYNVKAIWYEARGPKNTGIMQGHPSIKVTRISNPEESGNSDGGEYFPGTHARRTLAL